MFERFLARYPATEGASGPFTSHTEEALRQLGTVAPSYVRFMGELARSSFGRGVVRFLAPAELASWNDVSGWKAHWRPWSERLTVVATDWRGNQIGFDRNRLRDGQPLIGMLDVGAGEYFAIPATFDEYLNVELVDYPEEAAGAQRYESWLASGRAAPTERQCAGYSQPLFLGGEDSVENMEIIDMAVYVELHGQLFEQAARLPTGTKVGGFTIKD